MNQTVTATVIRTKRVIAAAITPEETPSDKSGSSMLAGAGQKRNRHEERNIKTNCHVIQEKA